jgi:hypothetical protein
VEVEFHLISSFTVDVGEFLPPSYGRFTPLVRRTSGNQSRCGHSGVENRRIHLLREINKDHTCSAGKITKMTQAVREINQDNAYYHRSQKER